MRLVARSSHASRPRVALQVFLNLAVNCTQVSPLSQNAHAAALIAVVRARRPIIEA